LPEENLTFLIEGVQPGKDIEIEMIYKDYDGNEICKDLVVVTVVEVKILKSKGSLDGNPNPIDSWSSNPCYHFDFQGVTSGSPGPYVLDLEGNIDPAPPLLYKWTLDAAAGTLTNETTATPTHVAPSTAGQGTLTLKAMHGTTDTGCKDEKKVKIYEDHLARDYENFGTGISCSGNWQFTKFNVTITMGNTWNCHGSTSHAYNGTYNSANVGQPWLSWSVKKVVVVNHDSNGNGTHDSLGTLERGDVVAYFSPNGRPYDPPNIADLPYWVMQHSQTCIGNGTDTYGANNEPKSYPGAPGQGQSWKWAISTAGDWGNHIWQPALQGLYVPFIIVVFDKPQEAQ